MLYEATHCLFSRSKALRGSFTYTLDCIFYALAEVLLFVKSYRYITRFHIGYYIPVMPSEGYFRVKFYRVYYPVPYRVLLYPFCLSKGRFRVKIHRVYYPVSYRVLLYPFCLSKGRFRVKFYRVYYPVSYRVLYTHSTFPKAVFVLNSIGYITRFHIGYYIPILPYEESV